MFRCILALAAVTSLVACGPTVTPPQSPGATAPVTQPAPSPADVVDKAAEAVAVASEKLDRAWSAYVVIRNVSEAVLMIPFLPPSTATAIRTARATIEGAFAKARATADLTLQAAELAKAAAAVSRLEALTVDPD